MPKCTYCDNKAIANKMCALCSATWNHAELTYLHFCAAMAGMTEQMQKDFAHHTAPELASIKITKNQLKEIAEC